MGAALDHVKRVKESKKTLETLMNNGDNVHVIHYSCESFRDIPDGRTPRITSIAVRHLATGQTHSFSIHKVAEIKGIAPDDISPAYDTLELEMLDEYFSFVRVQQGYSWLHWNMRDINFGFAAIEHRYSVLGGRPAPIENSRKHDLSRLLVARYGDEYIGHPRLEKLMQRNNITSLDFLSGPQEAAAFKRGEYVRLHQSTLRKVGVMAHLLTSAADGSLRHDASWRGTHGLSWPAVAELIKEHPIFVIGALVIAVIGIIVSL